MNKDEVPQTPEEFARNLDLEFAEMVSERDRLADTGYEALVRRMIEIHNKQIESERRISLNRRSMTKKEEVVADLALQYMGLHWAILTSGIDENAYTHF